MDIRLLGPDDDLEAELDLRRRAFGPVSAGDRADWIKSVRDNVADGRILGAFDGARLVASARYLVRRQWWHGRSMPMAGVGGVKVAPEERGRGVGRQLMTELAGELVRCGYPVATLYPNAFSFYRSLGWEVAGGKHQVVLPASALKPLAAPSPAADAASPAQGLRRATSADASLAIERQGRAHQLLRDCGPATGARAEEEEWLADEDNFGYLAEDGYLGYRWSGDQAELNVEWLVAASAGTARAFWQILASHAPVAERVRACLSPTDPLTWLVQSPPAQAQVRDLWMLRLLDPAAAIAARGFPPAVNVSACLEVSDRQLSDKASGRWLLEVEAGAGRLTRADSGDGPALRLGARGLAAMFGGIQLHVLRRAGLVGGDQALDAALDSAFAGPAFMLDYH